MNIDLSQFHETFFEESLEILDNMEQALLYIDCDRLDPDKIHQIFRSAHSIKGSSATFGFNQISEFTHTLEAFLEEVRSNRKALLPSHVELLLQSVNCLRSMIISMQNKTPVNDVSAKKLQAEFENLLHHEQTITALGWNINFTPDHDILKAGMDPLNIFNKLQNFGDLSTFANISQLPELSQLDQKECYLTWKLLLYTAASAEEIKSTFGFYSDEKSLSFIPLKTHENKISEHILQDTNELSHLQEIVPKHETSTVRVATEKIDTLINIVGELVITQSMLSQISENFDIDQVQTLLKGVSHLAQNCRELQENVMRIRMLPIRFVFNKFHRMVHDLALKMGKQVELQIEGEQTELDKTMLEQLADPLVHLVRNALDHGIELPEQRIEQGKPPMGIVKLSAYQQGGDIIIEVSDNGTGLNKEKILAKAISLGLATEEEAYTDEQIYEFIFQPGFTTAAKISEISGRGVGMDVVKKNIIELRGNIHCHTVLNQGSVFTITLPLTLAIMDCQLVKVGEQIFIIPLISITEIIKITQDQINHLGSTTELYQLRGQYIPIIHLDKVFSITAKKDIDNQFLIIVSVNARLYGLVVDEVSSQRQVVIKSLEKNYKKIHGISGATILGDGNLALIIDVNGIVDLSLGLYKLASSPIPIIDDQRMPLPDNMQFLSFLMANEQYGIDILAVKEIRNFEPAVPLPGAPAYVTGMINLRGAIVPIVDLRIRFDLPPQEPTTDTAIIILSLPESTTHRTLGLIVDAVSDTYYLDQCQINPVPECEDSPFKHFVRELVTIDGVMIRLLDTQLLMNFT